MSRVQVNREYRMFVGTIDPVCTCRAVGRSENTGGEHSNVVGIIYPPVETGLTDLPKNGGGTAPSPLAPTAMNCIRVQHSDSSFSIIN